MVIVSFVHSLKYHSYILVTRSLVSAIVVHNKKSITTVFSKRIQKINMTNCSPSVSIDLHQACLSPQRAHRMTVDFVSLFLSQE